jgi:hypothetical protein
MMPVVVKPIGGMFHDIPVTADIIAISEEIRPSRN